MDSQKNIPAPESLEAIRSKYEKEKKEQKKKGIGFAVGLLVIAFSIVGIVLSVNGIIDYFSQKNEEKSQGEFASYNAFFIPVAAVDPVPFDDLSAARPEELVEIAVWSIISSDLKPDDYVYTDKELLIPAGKVEQAFVKYFGTSVKINHTSVTGYGYEFAYSSEENTYYVPLTAIEPLYTPEVTGREVKGDTETITVGLINTASWKQDTSTGDISRPEPDKYIKVTLLKSGDNMYITSLRTSSIPEISIEDVFTLPETTAAAETETTTETQTTEEG